MAKRRGRGEGGIEELPSGNFRATLTVRVVGGKRDRLTETFPTRTQAADWLAETRTKYKFGKLAVTTLTVAEYLSAWLERRTPTVQGHTANWYGQHVARLKASDLAALPVRKLDRPTVERGVARMGTPDQQRKAMIVLRIALDDAAEDGLIPTNPARRARQARAEPKRVSFWTQEEARRVLEMADGSDMAACFWIALDAGLRVGELLGLHWPEVDLIGRTVRVNQSLEDIRGKSLRLKEPKTAKGRRVIRVGAGTVSALAAHRVTMKAQERDVESGPVFVGRNSGEMIRYRTFHGRYFKQVVEAAGVRKIRPYDMRHTCATLLLAAGVGIKVISDRLGHQNITTTLKHYAHCLSNAQDAAADAADRIFGVADWPPRGPEVKAGANVPCPPHAPTERPSTSSEDYAI